MVWVVHSGLLFGLGFYSGVEKGFQESELCLITCAKHPNPHILSI